MLHCTAADRHAQVAAFDSSFRNHTGCPDRQLLPTTHLRRALSPNARVLALDVGTNKGYWTATLFSELCPSVRFNPRSLRNHLARLWPEWTLGSTLCGVCGDCLTDTPKPSRATAQRCPVTAFGFDGNRKLVEMQQLVRRAHGHALEQAWFPQVLALGEEVGVGYFPAELGRYNEVGALQSSNDSLVPFDRLPVRQRHSNPVFKTHERTLVTTLNAFMQPFRLDVRAHPGPAPPVSFVLKIDGEGHDAAILDGARDALCGGNVTFFMFEKGSVAGTSWTDQPPGAVPSRLEAHMATFGGCGFECYALSGQRRTSRVDLHNLTFVAPSLSVAKLTNSCWDSTWERLSWANIVCVHNSAAALIDFYESRRIIRQYN
jgi:hypothetical protein